MKLIPLKANMTELQMGGGLTMLFSYQTPVACRWTNGSSYQNYKTDKKWSQTTSRHINGWFGGDGAIFKPQEYFDNLVNGGK
jgi:hypothetical protein